MAVDCDTAFTPTSTEWIMCQVVNYAEPPAVECLTEAPLQYVYDNACYNYSDGIQATLGVLGDSASIDSGNTAWMLFCAALVMIMTPALGLFYAGLAGEESVSNTLMMSVACMCIVSFQWFLVGYSFAFGPGNSTFGSFQWFALTPITWAPSGAYGGNIPHILWVIFQCMFAMITPAIISGSLVGRMKFSSFCLFVLIWTTVIYDPLAHWFWSYTVDLETGTYVPLGWLGVIGAIDFAGGEVIHISSGFAGLAAALVLGKRYKAGEPSKPHNVPMVMLGASLLWFGWFGFNAGSAGAASGLAAHAFFNTQLAAATAGLSWIATEKLTGSNPSAAGIAAGAVAGLVAITPACGFVHNYAAFVFGLLVSPICFFAQKLKTKIGVDDTLDAFALHGVAGIFGSLMTGLFATTDVNAAYGGFYYGEKLFGFQLLGVVVSASFSFFGTLAIMLLLKFTVGIRIAEDMEKEGIDVSEHGPRKM